VDRWRKAAVKQAALPAAPVPAAAAAPPPTAQALQINAVIFKRSIDMAMFRRATPRPPTRVDDHHDQPVTASSAGFRDTHKDIGTM